MTRNNVSSVSGLLRVDACSSDLMYVAVGIIENPVTPVYQLDYVTACGPMRLYAGIRF